jgi:PAS domain S-box-containing protein
MLHEESLRQSEERFRLLVEGVKDYAIFMLDPDGYIVSWNAGAERLKGYKATEIIGKHFSVFYPPDKIAEKWPEQELVMARADGRFEDEGWRIRKDGSRFWANVVITTLYDRHGVHRGFSKITRDMTERKRVEALELAERRMTEFLAILSHELRNPLAPIRNAVSIMQMMDLEDEHLRWAVEVIDRQATHMTRLVEDLLEVSRVTNNTIKLKHERFDLRDMAARAIESSQPLIDARNHTLTLSLPEKPIPVEGDPTRITQVVLNLLNNAAKYTPEGGLITLTIEEDGGEGTIRVRDNGIGITADFLPRMFDLFIQGGRSLDRSEGGLGIGLTLVQRLVEMHHGTVSATSEGPGQGSEFVVRLPLAAGTGQSDGSAQKAHRSFEPGDIRVLVVDDNQDIATTMSKLLSILGYQVRSVNDGAAALACVAEFRPDIVLLDIGLPTMTGYDVARKIRTMPEGASTTLIAITGYGQEEDRRRIREAGFSHHLVKPVDSHVLRALLASLAKERRSEHPRRNAR